MRFTVTVKVGDKVIISETRIEKIDHNTGLWSSIIKVPDQTPAGTHAKVVIEFHEIDQRLDGVYRKGRLIVNQLPYISALD